MLNPVAAGDAATYSVVVSDADPSSATSTGAALTVRAAVTGDVDFGFAGGASVNGNINAVAVQADGKVIIGGAFTTVGGAVRGRIARLNADGTTDHWFGQGLVGANDTVYAVAVQSDGKVVIGGNFTTVNGTTQNYIARLNSDGTLDTSFGHGLAGVGSTVLAVAVQSDGKVVIGGFFTTVHGTTINRIARLNSNGTLDTDFGNGLAGANSNVNAVAVQSDGRVVIGGLFTSVNGTARGRIARLNSDGTLDTGFGNGVGGANNTVNAVGVQSDGKVVIGGAFNAVNGTTINRIARLNSDGTLDTAFGNGLAGAGSTVNAVGVQSDGKVVIGGAFTSVHSTARNRIARLNSDGTLDTDFGNGLAGANGQVIAVAVQSDGNVVIGGLFTSVHGTSRGRIARLNSDGTLDTGFGNGPAGADNQVSAVAVQSDGKVVIGGTFTSVHGTTRNRIARLNGDGTLDTSFGNGLVGAGSAVNAVAVQSDGKVVIGGFFTLVNSIARGRIARLNSDGTLDTGFGNGLAGANGTVYAVGVQSDGKVVIGGNFLTVNGTTRGSIARLNSDGTLDTDFGNGLAGANGIVYAVGVQSDGKVVIGGVFTSVNGTTRNRIARLNSDGTLDTAFGNGLGGASNTVYAAAVQSDGKVVLGGDFSAVHGTVRVRIARLNSDGTLDTGFGNGLGGANLNVNAVAVQSDGKMVIGGSFSTVNGTARGRIARLNSDGTLDTDFGNGLAGPNGTVLAVAVQSDGQLVLGGTFNSVNDVVRVGYARLLGGITTVAPTVSAPTSTSVTITTATLGGNVTSDGGASITARGVVYSKTSENANPEIGGTNVTNVTTSGTTGVFTVPVSGLSQGTSYTFKAYATNSVGTSYTSAGTFTTVSNTLPTLSLPTSPVIAEATSGAGATVTFTVTADDAEDGPLTPTVSAASGSLFALGDTTVNVSATDGMGGNTTGSFVVGVRDTTAPTLQAPVGGFAPLEVLPMSPLPDYAAQAVSYDAVGSITVVQTPAAGTTYNGGPLAVTLVATDTAGNPSTVLTINVSQANRAPVATDDVVTFSGATTTFNPLLNDTDPDNDTLTIIDVGDPSTGSVTFTGNSITYTKDGATFDDQDGFTYTVSDGKGGEDTAAVIVASYNSLAGTYTGLLDDGTGHADGIFRATVASNGNLTGRAVLNGRVFGLSGRLDSTGADSLVSAGVTFEVQMQMAGTVVGETRQHLSVVAVDTGVTFTGNAILHAYSSPSPVSVAGVGYYHTAQIAQSGQTGLPASPGWMRMLVAKSGAVTVSGRGPDTLPVSCATAIVVGGQVMVYANGLQSNPKTEYAGVLNLTLGGAVSGTMKFNKLPQATAKGALHGTGFSGNYDTVGGKYVKPSAGTRVLTTNGAGQVQATMTGAGHASPTTKTLTLSVAHAFTPLPSAPLTLLRINASGQLTGTVKSPTNTNMAIAGLAVPGLSGTADVQAIGCYLYAKDAYEGGEIKVIAAP
ncbi:MAG: cadherin-like domain-containing protein [Verrucomicrobiaceae bacterium]|nr:cadherin-like domain-containing protein [Verrucomicrobiaceae bacterium]